MNECQGRGLHTKPTCGAGRRTGILAVLLLYLVAPSTTKAQTAASVRLAVLQAAERGATTPADLRTLRSAVRSADSDTARLALRALGRLERPSLIADILPALGHRLPEVRTEAADALAQSAAGFGTSERSGGASLSAVEIALSARLAVEADPPVRAVLRESIAHLPYRNAGEIAGAERTILSPAPLVDLSDRLGVARALEILQRLHGATSPLSGEAIATLEDLAQNGAGLNGHAGMRDARVRRLALEALTGARRVTEPLIEQAANDPDAQVRRLAMLAAGVSGTGLEEVQRCLTDAVPIVRLEALRALAALDRGRLCPSALSSTLDPDLTVVLVAVDELAACGGNADAVAYLETAVADRSELNAPRAWHRNAHALVSLAAAAPDRLGPQLLDYAQSHIWQVRQYAARAAATLNDRDALDMLSHDAHDTVANIARTVLGLPLRVAGPPRTPSLSPLTAAEFRRLSASRARITIRDVGRIDLALFTTEAPLTVVRFVHLAREGYYNGTVFDRLVPNVMVQGGDRPQDRAVYPREEAGLWPHVRGAVGLSMRDTGDARFFIDLVDNPRFDHRYTVFAQILNGADVADRILEGDIIESIEIFP